jgi:hypothetical protein
MRAILALSILLAACYAQPQPAYYPQQQQGYYAQQPPQQQGYYAQQPQQGGLAPAPARAIRINGYAASAQDLATLDRLEQQWGGRLPSGDYWYDNQTGAAGRWGGPMAGIMAPGLNLGGPLPPNASGGGDGRLTNVFINGRELHPYDVQRLQALVGQVYQGRWFVDGQGNFGLEGGAVLGNLYSLAQQRGGNGGRGGGDSYYSRDQNGSAFVGGGCVSVSTKSGSYYGSGC